MLKVNNRPSARSFKIHEKSHASVPREGFLFLSTIWGNKSEISLKTPSVAHDAHHTALLKSLQHIFKYSLVLFWYF